MNKELWDDSRRSNMKIIISGDVIEIYKFEKSVQVGRKDEQKDGLDWVEKYSEEVKAKNECKDIPDEVLKTINRKKSRNRTSNNIRRLATANFNSRSKFITLTFKDTDDFDVKNPTETNKEFKKFIQRMRRRFGDFRYIAVIEFQDKNGRGAVHYHIISDVEYIAQRYLSEIWGLGRVDIRDIRHVDNVGAYISKYVTKNIEDTRMDGLPVYLSSRNLIRSKEIRGKQAELTYELLKRGYVTPDGELIKIDKKNTVYENEYTSEYCGKITYEEYNMRRQKNEVLL
ncbi:MAG TPA: hypothetical protein VFX18_06095 [Candidatus Nitrosocosmicus sp.]|nr:hypothetical protein [Candidatus Nitrosocosmicus sp.]